MLSSCNNRPIPQINIIKKGAIGWNKKEPCLIEYSNQTIQDTLTGKIKCRGGMSSQYDKHSFALELDKKKTLNNLKKEDDWILNASYIDKTFMRHKLSYDLFKEMNAHNISPNSSYLRVLLNGEYEGLYVLMEKITPSTIGLKKSDSLSMLFKEIPLFFDQEITNWDSILVATQKFPKKHVFPQKQFIQKFKSFIMHANTKVFSENIHHWVDLNNIMDWHLLLLLSNNSDGLLKNFYLYKQNNNTPFRIAIWDYDHSFGRDGDNEMNMAERIIQVERNQLLKRLMHTKDLHYPKKLKNRWNSLRNSKTISVDNITQHLNNNHQNIKHEIIKNQQKWPWDSHWYYDTNTYEQEYNLILTYTALRITQLDNYFDSL